MNEQVCRNCRAELVWLGSMKDGQLGCPHGCELHDYEDARITAPVVCSSGLKWDEYDIDKDNAIQANDTCNLADYVELIKGIKLQPWQKDMLQRLSDEKLGYWRDAKPSDFFSGQIGTVEGFTIHHSPRQCGKTEMKRMWLSTDWEPNKIIFDESSETAAYPSIREIVKESRAKKAGIISGVDIAHLPDLSVGAVYEVKMDKHGVVRVDFVRFDEIYEDPKK